MFLFFLSLYEFRNLIPRSSFSSCSPERSEGIFRQFPFTERTAVRFHLRELPSRYIRSLGRKMSQWRGERSRDSRAKTVNFYKRSYLSRARFNRCYVGYAESTKVSYNTTAFASCVRLLAYVHIAKVGQGRGETREERGWDSTSWNFQGLSGEAVWLLADQRFRPGRAAGMAERSNASSTSSLTLPQMPGQSPDGGASPRRAVSPLLEVRRPHCTLNCESCSIYLEDIYRHSTCPFCATRRIQFPE